MARRSRPGCSCALLLLALASCGTPEPVLLVLDLKTDYLPELEVDRARVELIAGADGAAQRVDPVSLVGRDLLRGVRLAELELAPGRYEARVQLERGGAAVAERALTLEVRADLVATVLISRSCADVVCDGDLDQCAGGVCVARGCTPETPELCPPPQCASDAECEPALACAAAVCEDGVCFETPSDDRCALGYRCDLLEACVPAPTEHWAEGPEFGAPELLSSVNVDGADDLDPFLSADGLTLFFSSARGGSLSVWRSERPRLDAPFGAPSPVDVGADSSSESGFRITPDERVALVSSNRSGGQGLSDIWFAQRDDPSAPFVEWFPVPELSSAGEDLDPFPTATQVWTSPPGAPGGLGGQDLFVADATLPGSIGAPRLVASLSSSGNDSNAALTADERVIVFASDRLVAGDSDLYYALRGDDGELGAPIRIDALSTDTEIESEPFLRADGRELFFTVGAILGGMQLVRVDVR